MASIPKKVSRRQRGILLLISLGFASSAILRVGSFDMAFAAQDTGTTPDVTYQADLLDPIDDALARVIGRAEEMDAREAALQERETQIDNAAAQLRAQIAHLEALEARLEGLVTISDTAAETDLAQLTRVYETMSPDAAATLFDQMAPSFAAGFLSRMRPETGAAILAELTPESAYAISVVLATRNADAPVGDSVNSAQGDTEN